MSWQHWNLMLANRFKTKHVSKELTHELEHNTGGNPTDGYWTSVEQGAGNGLSLSGKNRFKTYCFHKRFNNQQRCLKVQHRGQKDRTEYRFSRCAYRLRGGSVVTSMGEVQGAGTFHTTIVPGTGFSLIHRRKVLKHGLTIQHYDREENLADGHNTVGGIKCWKWIARR